MTENNEKQEKQYGLWNSPIPPISLARGLSFSNVCWDDDGTLLWRESRSDFSTIVIQAPDGQAPRDLNDIYNIRARVGYGGGDFTAGGGFVYFIEADSGGIYRQPTLKGTTKPVTPSFGFAASPVLSPDRTNILYVHSSENKDCLGLVDVEGMAWPVKLVSGEDFYMQPCWHPDGRSIAWISWNHPQMPWDGTRLNLGALDEAEGRLYLRDVVPITGGEDVSIFQPQFSPDGRYLVYISDALIIDNDNYAGSEAGAGRWWQLYSYDLYHGEHTRLTNVQAEHGIPAWVQGLRTYEFSPDGGNIFFLRNQDTKMSLWKIDLETKVETQINTDPEYSWFNQIAVSPKGDELATIASGGGLPSRVVRIRLEGETVVERRSIPENLKPESYSKPESIYWEGMDGGRVYGVFYSPKNEAFVGMGLPPLMVLVHGGPTSQKGTSFDMQAQFFASRGWAVLQVNYRGSTGYGREYRDLLKGNWGIYDVQDSVSGALYLVDSGEVDKDKMVIMGGSAGGFTVLKALEDYPGFFKAGICLYGVSNQFSLVADTHKFEEHYSDSLLGSLPEAASVYRDRSPSFHADKIQDPIAIFQGEEDRVVPPNQSEEIVSALERNGIPHEYHLFPDEGHGFRKTETIEKFYTAVEKFLKLHVIYA